MNANDSVDGKLARVTFTSSKIGEILDHGLDIVHPPIWYMAWGFALGGGSYASAPWLASLWMLGMYVGDRVVTEGNERLYPTAPVQPIEAATSDAAPGGAN